jgi:hypothetical protein
MPWWAEALRAILAFERSASSTPSCTSAVEVYEVHRLD